MGVYRQLQGKADNEVVKAIRELYDFVYSLKGQTEETKQQTSSLQASSGSPGQPLLRQGLNLQLQSPINFFSGQGSPENVIVGSPGDIFINTNGVGTTLFSKATGVSTSTGWVPAPGNTWISWTPTWTNLSVGNGTVVAKWTQIGKTVFARVSLVFGSTTSISGSVSFSMPTDRATYGGTAGLTWLGGCRALDASAVVLYEGIVVNATTSTAAISFFDSSATYVTRALASSTVPFTWTTSDEIALEFFYEGA